MKRNKKKEKRKENKKFPYKEGGKYRCSIKEKKKKLSDTYIKNNKNNKLGDNSKS